MRFLHKIFEIIQISAAISIALLILGFFLKVVVEPFAPIITILVVLFFTLFTFSRWITAILSVEGIALYIISFPALSMWGTELSLFLWLCGTFAWLTAVYLSIIPLIDKKIADGQQQITR